MNQIEHIIEPERLLLVWRSPHSPRTRRVVAEVRPSTESTRAVLRYLIDSTEYASAKQEGFSGYPAFSPTQTEHYSNVLESFLRRLPPRKRDDFTEYLERHRLPTTGRLTDMALLGYTNAKLPSDGFEIYADLSNARPPFEVVVEVAGFRHQSLVAADDMYIGDPIVFKAEPDNVHDSNAIAIFYNSSRIGYVDRAQASAFQTWMRRGYSLNATVERINGKADRPLVYVYVAVR
jgi:hypothetical protein